MLNIEQGNLKISLDLFYDYLEILLAYCNFKNVKFDYNKFCKKFYKTETILFYFTITL